MKFTENRPLAAGILAVVIAGSVLIGGGNSLSRQKKVVDAAFFAPSESISAELKEMTDNAVVMNSIMSAAKDADQDKVNAVSTAISEIQNLEEKDGIGARYQTGLALSEAVENLYSAASNVTLKQTDADDFRYRYKNFSSARLRISHDGYNDLAIAFNEEKDDVLAGLVSAVRGIPDAQLFNW